LLETTFSANEEEAVTNIKKTLKHFMIGRHPTLIDFFCQEIIAPPLPEVRTGQIQPQATLRRYGKINFMLKLPGLVLFTPPLLALLCLTSFAGELKPDPKLSKVIASCKSPKKDAPYVYFFKQWHLGPNVDSQKNKGPYPQEKNLAAIYQQLDSWVEAGKLSKVIAEGCEGPLDSTSTLRINGWTVSDLEKAKANPDFSKIATSVPLKIEAKYGTRVDTLCGDSNALVKEQLLNFSDARGDAGYLSRILQYENDPIKIKPYLNDLIQLLNLPANTLAKEAEVAIEDDLKKTIQKIRATLQKRNEHLVESILASKEKTIAVVFGGMHAEGVKALLEAKGLPCSIIEPIGYENDEALLLKQLEQLLKKNRRASK
jgi:hypothetical protein